MKAQQYGRIVNISSSAGRMVSTLGGAHYTASKTGLLGLTRAAAKELGQVRHHRERGLPGHDRHRADARARDARAARAARRRAIRCRASARRCEVADLICFAASEAAGYITGASFDINGGDLMM